MEYRWRTRLIAECASNHGGSRAWLAEAIRGCADAGVDIVKVQAYDVAHLRAGDPQAEWLRQAQLSLDDLRWFAGECRRIGVEPLASVFSPELVRPLADMGYPAIKIGSGDAMRDDLVDACCEAFETVYVSTGLLSDAEVRNVTVAWGGMVIPVHAVTRYPCPAAAVQLDRPREWGAWGYSDHCIGLAACRMAIAAGAVVVEKHLRLDHGRQCDWDATIAHFRDLVYWRDLCATMAGDGAYQPNPEGEARFIGRWTA